MQPTVARTARSRGPFPFLRAGNYVYGVARAGKPRGTYVERRRPSTGGSLRRLLVQTDFGDMTSRSWRRRAPTAAVSGILAKQHWRRGGGDLQVAPPSDYDGNERFVANKCDPREAGYRDALIHWIEIS